MLQDMELWSKIRRLLARGMSKRHAVKHFNLNFRTIDKISKNVEPGTYQRPPRTEPSIGLLQIASHHLFEYHFCRIYEPQEKGHVENCVKYSRNNWMVPVPHFPTFAAFNEYLEQKCRSEFDKTSAGREKTIGKGNESIFSNVDLYRLYYLSNARSITRLHRFNNADFYCQGSIKRSPPS